MTNFEHYKTKDAAFSAYGEHVEALYNVHQGVSAGRFIDWLYSEYDPKIEDMKAEQVEYSSKYCSDESVDPCCLKDRVPLRCCSKGGTSDYKCWEVTFLDKEGKEISIGVMANGTATACKAGQKSLEEGRHLKGLQFFKIKEVDSI